jgi:uncharacterized delta-60 repeat protein
MKRVFVYVISCFCLSVFAQPGTLDLSFDPGAGAGNNWIQAIDVQSDGKILLGGSFTTYAGVTQNRFVRVNSNGTVDNTFNIGSGPISWVKHISVLSNNNSVISGDFSSYNATARNYVAEITSTGSLNSNFVPNTIPGSYVNVNKILSNGQILVGGIFSKGIALLNSNGTSNPSFNIGTGANDWVQAMAVQGDGKILIGGSFTLFNGVTRNRIARLNADGSLDTSFDPQFGASSAVRDICIQPDGKIIVVGEFTTFNAISYNRIVRLNSNGSVDNTFAIGNGASGNIISCALQSDNKVVIGGNFSTFDGNSSSKLARINTDGSFDVGFNVGSGANGTIRKVFLQQDGAILIGGDFTDYNGVTRNRVARILSGLSPSNCNRTVAINLPSTTNINDMLVDNFMFPYLAQVFTPLISTANFNVSLPLATCKSNGLCDAKLNILTVTAGEPDWNNIIGTVIVPESQIYGLPDCNSINYGTTTFSFTGVNLVAGTQYALNLKPINSNSWDAHIRWQQNDLQLYNGGSPWQAQDTVNFTNSYEHTQSDLLFNVFTNEITPGIDTRTECKSFTWIDGNTYTSSNNTAEYTIVGGASCGGDSIVKLNLTINNVSDISVQLNGSTIIAANNLATYQWLDCLNNYSNIAGATNQSYTPTSIGSYAVKLSENNCIDTSSCINVTTVGLFENSFSNKIIIYPNPTNGKTTIGLENIHEKLRLDVYDITGKLIDTKLYLNTKQVEYDLNQANGIYLFKINDDNFKEVKAKIIKE